MPSTTDDCKIYILRQLGEVHEASAPGMQIVAALEKDLFATDAWNVRNPHGFTNLYPHFPSAALWWYDTRNWCR